MEIVSIAGQGHLWASLVLVIGIIALPGADMAFIIGNTVAGGRSLGVAATSGIVAGGIAVLSVIVLSGGVNRMGKCFDFEFMNVISS